MTSIPAKVNKNINSFSVGGCHTCAFQSQNKNPPTQQENHYSSKRSNPNTKQFSHLSCWGCNMFNQTSNPQITTEIVGTSLGAAHSCILINQSVPSEQAPLTLSQVVCWGNNDINQTNVPELVNRETSGPYLLVSGRDTSCTLIQQGHLACWGDNSQGIATTPQLFDSGTLDVALGQTHACAVTARGQLECWGKSQWGQAEVGNQAIWRWLVYQVSCGQEHTCAVQAPGRLDCWGRNDEMQAEVKDKGLLGVAAGQKHTCALDVSNAKSILVKCWGSDEHGQSTIPKQVNT